LDLGGRPGALRSARLRITPASGSGQGIVVGLAGAAWSGVIRNDQTFGLLRMRPHYGLRLALRPRAGRLVHGRGLSELPPRAFLDRPF
jgi:hypothetical protein